jgi:thioredoxin-like negative regulator of GroEL
VTKDGLSVRNRQMSAIATLQAEPPREFIGRAVRVADHWRQVDPDPTAAYQAAARILSELGAAEMAWEYLTTPLAAKRNYAAPWVSMAERLREQAYLDLADRANASAFEAEPTNAQIIWDRAQALLQAGRAEGANEVFGQLADGEWQPRFGSLKSRARQYLDRNRLGPAEHREIPHLLQFVRFRLFPFPAIGRFRPQPPRIVSRTGRDDVPRCTWQVAAAAIAAVAVMFDKPN